MLAHPEDRGQSENEITQGSAANTGQAGQKQKTDEVQLLARGGKRAGRGKYRNARMVQPVQYCHSGSTRSCPPGANIQARTMR